MTNFDGEEDAIDQLGVLGEEPRDKQKIGGTRVEAIELSRVQEELLPLRNEINRGLDRLKGLLVGSRFMQRRCPSDHHQSKTDFVDLVIRRGSTEVSSVIADHL